MPRIGSRSLALAQAFSRSSWRTRSLASLVIPSRSPVSISVWCTQCHRVLRGHAELVSYRLNRCPLKKGIALGGLQPHGWPYPLPLVISASPVHSNYILSRVGVSKNPGVIQSTSWPPRQGRAQEPGPYHALRSPSSRHGPPGHRLTWNVVNTLR